MWCYRERANKEDRGKTRGENGGGAVRLNASECDVKDMVHRRGKFLRKMNEEERL